MVKKDKTMTIISKSCHHYEKREWIQNGYYQNGECYKTAKSQNGEITKQRLLQNSDCYKTATTTKRQLLQKNIVIYSTKTATVTKQRKIIY